MNRVFSCVRGTSVALASALVVVVGFAAHAASTTPVNTMPDGVALDGYDTVAYFNGGTAQKGDAAYSTEWDGATWYFASAENRDAFASDPDAYAPQHGGWCSYAASDGYVAEVDVVDGWAIIDNKLYLNWDKDTKDAFIEEQGDRISSAHDNWPGLRADLTGGEAEISRHADYPDYNPYGIVHPQ